MYKSFVRCDDPKGVIECKPMRKAKTDSQKRQEIIKNHEPRKTSNTSSSDIHDRKDKVSEGSKDELQNLSSSQIMEVSRGAQKLNEVIYSWSNGVGLEKQSKHIAEDLLRGALDLQESLVMLGKLQDASNYMAKLKKKQKEKAVKERLNAIGTKCVASDLFGDYNHALDLQKPRISSDGSSRDCYEELREVIIDNFARQNILPRSSHKEIDYLERRKSDFSMDLPSSSSSQSSLVYSHDFASTHSSPPKFEQEKPRGSNLIAKLMGLEEVPVEHLHSISGKQPEKDKVPYQNKQLFDIDLPRTRKPQFIVQKAVREHRRLEEMIETMQFKGLLERESVHESPRDKDSIATCLRKTISDDCPPIVIIRPRHVADLQYDDFQADQSQQSFKSKEVFRTLRGEPRRNAVAHQKGTPELTKPQRSLPRERSTGRKLDRDKETQVVGDADSRLDGRRNKRQAYLSSMDVKTSRCVNSNIQKKEATVEKVGKVQKTDLNARKSAETRNTQPPVSSQANYLAKTASLKVRKSNQGTYVLKTPSAHEKTTTSQKYTKSTAFIDSSIGKKKLKNLKSDRKASVAIVEDMLPIDPANTVDSDVPIIKREIITEEPPEQILEEASHYSDSSRFDNRTDSATSHVSCTLNIKEDIESVKEADFLLNLNSDEMKSCKGETSLRSLLLSSTSFLSHVQDAFDAWACGPTTASPRTWLQGFELLDTDLLLECANEILEHKSLLCTMETYLLRTLITKPRYPLDHLVWEICKTVEDLWSYRKLYGNIAPEDSTYPMLEKDLQCRGDLAGPWDLGWRNGFTLSEIEDVVADIAKLVYSELLEDILTDSVFK